MQLGSTASTQKKAEYSKREIFARSFLYHFCESITTYAVILQKDTKRACQANRSLAIHVCRHFVRFHAAISPPDVEMPMQKRFFPLDLDAVIPA